MRRNQETMLAASKATLERLNAVHDYYPEAFEIERDGKRIIPTIALLGQFRLRYPDGQIPCKVKHMGDGRFAAHARVYKGSSSDQANFLAEAYAIRKPKPQAEGIDPAGWAQTAAIGTALRNAGFGLSYALDGCIIGDENPDMNDTGGFPAREDSDISQKADKPNSLNNTANGDLEGCNDEAESPEEHEEVAKAVEVEAESDEQAESSSADLPPEDIDEEEQSVEAEEPEEADTTAEMTIDEAVLVPAGIKKFKDNTIGDLIELDPKAIGWLIKNGKTEQIRQAALIVSRDAAIKQESA